MKLLTFQSGSGPRAGLLRDGTVVDLGNLGAQVGRELPSRTAAYVRDPLLLAKADDAVDMLGEDLPSELCHALDTVSLRAPLRPGKILGVGLNYVEHVDESSRSLDTDKELPSRPVLFSKPGTAVIGQEEPILHNSALTKQLDWEVELAVVIGRSAFRVSRDVALEHVFGYAILNDISARDQRRSGQWFFSKGQDSYAPFGPWIVTADEVPDPQDLDLSLRVNGEVKQESNTRHMLFKVAELIEDISSGMTLESGDVIATGSPAGVGAAQRPPQYLQPGDFVELEIEKIGRLGNPVVAVQ